MSAQQQIANYKLRLEATIRAGLESKIRAEYEVREAKIRAEYEAKLKAVNDKLTIYEAEFRNDCNDEKSEVIEPQERKSISLNQNALELDDSGKIVITPITLPNNNYVIEQNKFARGGSRWSDTRRNNAEKGDRFGFLHQDCDCIEIFQVVNILPASSRPEHWTDEGRRVLVLSAKLGEISWMKYKADSGYKPDYWLIGTERLKWAINLHV